MKINLMKSCLVLLAMMATIAVNESNAATIEKMNKKELQALNESESEARLQMLENRVKEIEAMDIKSLPRAERREIAKELREIKKQHDFLAEGVYLSVGAIIIILLILILLT